MHETLFRNMGVPILRLMPVRSGDDGHSLKHRMTPARDRPSRPSLQSETVLMVEDDASVRGPIAEALQRIGYSVLEAETAAEGLETYECERPDLVLLDMNLPDRSGLEILDELHANGAVVVFLTGSSDVATAVQAMQRGAESYLTKPVEFAQLAV